jgi:hypothetical protein
MHLCRDRHDFRRQTDYRSGTDIEPQIFEYGEIAHGIAPRLECFLDLDRMPPAIPDD